MEGPHSQRVAQTKEALEAKKLKEQSKIRDYLALTENVLNRVRSEPYVRSFIYSRVAIFAEETE